MKENKMKQNSLELTQSQVKRVIEAEKGETIMLMFPIDENKMSFAMWERIKKDHYSHADNLFSKDVLGVQKGDKDIWIKEEFGISLNGTVAYMSDYTNTDRSVTSNLLDIKDASKMTKEQSRLTISECIDVRIVRVQDIARKGYFDGADIKEDILKGLGISWIGYFNRECYEEIGCDLFVKLYNNQLKEQNINRTYEDNDYVFLMEVRK